MTDDALTWHQAATAAQVQPDEPIAVTVADRELVLYNVDGAIYATDALCTHAEACLADGFQEGDEIECPLHEGRFHIPSGRATAEPASEALRVYPVRVEDTAVMVGIG